MQNFIKSFDSEIVSYEDFREKFIKGVSARFAEEKNFYPVGGFLVKTGPNTFMPTLFGPVQHQFFRGRDTIEFVNHCYYMWDNPPANIARSAFACVAVGFALRFTDHDVKTKEELFRRVKTGAGEPLEGFCFRFIHGNRNIEQRLYVIERRMEADNKGLQEIISLHEHPNGRNLLLIPQEYFNTFQ